MGIVPAVASVLACVLVLAVDAGFFAYRSQRAEKRWHYSP
jgi:hypothetical protein